MLPMVNYAGRIDAAEAANSGVNARGWAKVRCVIRRHLPARAPCPFTSLKENPRKFVICEDFLFAVARGNSDKEIG